MSTRSFVLAALAAVILPTAGQAQRVFADVRIGEGPVRGHILIASPRYHDRPYGYYGPREYPRYRVIEVYRVHRGPRWYRDHGYRPVRVWYDDDRDCYYDRYAARFDRGHERLREIVLYEREGGYYRADDRDDDRRRTWRDDWRDERNDYRGRTDRRDDDDRR